MADTKLRIRKATTLLREDHRKVKRLFRAFEKLEDDDQAGMTELFEQVKRALTVHAQIEEEIFYPAVGRAEDQDAGEMVTEAREEHKIVKTLLDEISRLSPSDDAETFCAKMKVLQENVLHHAEEEEKDIFKLFDDLDRDVRDEVSERLYARKRELSPEEPA